MAISILLSSGYIHNERKRGKKKENRECAYKREEAHPLNKDTTESQSRASGGYISLVAHIWVGDDGSLIRGTIEDAHTGARLAIDFSAFAALLQESLAHASVVNLGEEEALRGNGGKMPMEGSSGEKTS